MRKIALIFLAVPLLGWGQGVQSVARTELDSCHLHQVKELPGSHEFGSDFLEAMAGDPDANAREPNSVWGLTADVSSEVPAWSRAMYISKSTDGGKTWSEVARIGAQYFNAEISEGERNSLVVLPGGNEFVVTTQLGAFQVVPGANANAPAIKPIEGFKVPRPDPRVSIPKKEGDPLTANVAKITPDGKRLIVGYGYFDLHPQIFTYRRGDDGSWMKEGPLPRLPTQMDILSMQFGDVKSAVPTALYVGTGDQVFRLDENATRWMRIRGVGPDSAVQGMSMVGGPHFAACWGVYNPVSDDEVERVTEANFLLHRGRDDSGPNIRAYTIEVDALRPSHEVVTSLTGVYVSSDSGKTWKRLNQLPAGEFRAAHFNPEDGTVIVSGILGTFLADPFSTACLSRLKTRVR